MKIPAILLAKKSSVCNWYKGIAIDRELNLS